jgi:hypothetical protein
MNGAKLRERLSQGEGIMMFSPHRRHSRNIGFGMSALEGIVRGA